MRMLVTGSTTGVGLATAMALADAGHEVILHARNATRAAEVRGLGSGVVVGDLGEPVEVRRLVDDLRSSGPFDVVIHNAGVYGLALHPDEEV